MNVKKKKESVKKNKTKSKILDSVYESVRDMHEIGIVDALTMHKFELMCKGKKPERSD